MLLGTAPQRRGAAAHALLSAAADGGAGGARWARVMTEREVRICVDWAWVLTPCAEAEMRSGAAVARGVLHFLAGVDDGPPGFTLVGGAFAVPGPAGGADIDVAGELWVARAAGT